MKNVKLVFICLVIYPLMAFANNDWYFDNWEIDPFIGRCRSCYQEVEIWICKCGNDNYKGIEYCPMCGQRQPKNWPNLPEDEE